MEHFPIFLAFVEGQVWIGSSDSKRKALYFYNQMLVSLATKLIDSYKHTDMSTSYMRRGWNVCCIR